MQPLNLPKTKKIISPARLSSYVQFFKPQSDMELYGVYCWNLQLSSCFYDLISVVEVALRNRVHYALSGYFSPGSLSFAWYHGMQLSGKTKDKIKKITHNKTRGRNPNWLPKNPAPSPDDIVSRVTFGFWKNVLQAKRLARGGNIPWENILINVAINHRNNDVNFWKKERNRDSLCARIETVNRIRNRICHFEPIWKQKELYEELLARPGLQPKVLAPAPVTPSDSIKRLRLLHSRSLELLYWLSKSRAADYRNSESCKRFYAVCSDLGLLSYRNQQPYVESSVNDWDELRQHMESGRRIKILDADNILGYYYPK